MKNAKEYRNSAKLSKFRQIWLHWRCLSMKWKKGFFRHVEKMMFLSGQKDWRRFQNYLSWFECKKMCRKHLGDGTDDRLEVLGLKLSLQPINIRLSIISISIVYLVFSSFHLSFFKWAIPGLFFVNFCLFKHTLQFLQK